MKNLLRTKHGKYCSNQHLKVKCLLQAISNKICDREWIDENADFGRQNGKEEKDSVTSDLHIPDENQLK